MKFLIGEGGLSYLERLSYRGVIGIFFDNTWTGVLSYCIVAIILLLAVIGLIAVLSLIFNRKKRKKSKDPYQEWIKMGKF